MRKAGDTVGTVAGWQLRARAAMIGAILVGVTTPVHAAWFFKGSDGDFGDDGMNLALGIEGDYSLGIRCQGTKLDLVYITSEEDTDGNASTITLLHPKLKLRIDSGEIQEIEATADTFGDDDNLGFVADIPNELVDQIAKAKSRVAVVIEVVGQKYHEQRFGVAGSTKAIASLKAKCPHFSAGDENADGN